MLIIKNGKILQLKKNLIFFIKNCNLPIPKPPLKTSRLQKMPLALKREHPALQNMKFLNFFKLLWVIFALLDPAYESGYGSNDLIESGSNSDPKLCKRVRYGSGVKPIGTKRFFYRNRNTVYYGTGASKKYTVSTQAEKVIVQLGCW
jgi:hypothetical protein